MATSATDSGAPVPPETPEALAALARREAENRKALWARRASHIASLRDGLAEQLEVMSRRPAGRNWGKDDPFHDPAYEAALAGPLREIAAILGVPSNPAATAQPAATRPANPTGDAS